MGAAAAAEELQQQLVSLWLEGGAKELSAQPKQQVGGRPQYCAPAPAGSSIAGLEESSSSGELPGLLQRMRDAGYLQLEEVLAAGDPAQWAAAAAAAGPPTSTDRRVAATAVLMACKMAGAVAELPQLLLEVQGAAAQQPWVCVLAGGTSMDLEQLQGRCNTLAAWALLLAPVVGLSMPRWQAAQLQEVAAGVSHDSQGQLLVTADASRRVLHLLGHVAGPGAPGCSYPDCCNLEGRTEAELPVQACTKCRGARYCCREHQVLHWKTGHKEECLKVQTCVKHVCKIDVAAGRSDQGTGSR